ncbi:MAG: hydantoinase B/oxoprolinase family protein [Candidatus Hermodarchaeota archaeon]
MQKIDSITLTVVNKSLENIAEEMGVALMRTGYSPNIKERLDFSTAIFNGEGELVAQAEHIPVHLGAMSLSVQEGLKRCTTADLTSGDILIHNDPFMGGTHLPDITLIAPVFVEDQNEPIFYIANRAHHADVGGSVPGSMPGASTEIFQEGVIIPPIKLYSQGDEVKDVMNLILANVRTAWERKGDLRAQRAAINVGITRIQELVNKIGAEELKFYEKQLMDISEQATRAELQCLKEGTFKFQDYMDSDGFGSDPVKIQATIILAKDEVTIDFEGTAPQSKGNINATRGVTISCVYYVFRAITDPKIPTNQGCFRPLQIHVPEGCLLNPKWPAACSSGNVETSQRIVDVLMGALAQASEKIPAASQGTMNNITIGGRTVSDHFSYYETIGGGMGARPKINYGEIGTRAKKDGIDGIDGIHCHMTNTKNTPIEALELAYPMRIEYYGLVPDSGGRGEYRGGLGIRRDIKMLESATVSIQSERRKLAPWGLKGGKPGKVGENWLIISSGKKEKLPGKITIEVEAGDIIRIITPGGGGWEDPEKRNRLKAEKDRKEGKISRELV